MPIVANIRVRSRLLFREISEYTCPFATCKLYALPENAVATITNAIPTLQIARPVTGLSTLPSNCFLLWLGIFDESRNISSGSISCIFTFRRLKNPIWELYQYTAQWRKKRNYEKRNSFRSGSSPQTRIKPAMVKIGSG